MGESELPTPISIQRAAEEDLVASALGLGVAGVLRYQMLVLDREDRLESGTGTWRTAFVQDRGARERTVRQSVLRTLQMAAKPEYYGILERLRSPEHLTTTDLAKETDLTKLTLHERVSDLVSAGLVTKVPEADQVAITPAGTAVVELVRRAVAVAGHDLEEVE